jgi:hypothetical protein
MHQYKQGSLIHSSCQLESSANDGDLKLIHIPWNLQCIHTVNSHVGMRPYTDVEYESPPHVTLTSNLDWDPRLLDFHVDDNNDWYDMILDNVNHSELVDALLTNST